MRSLTPCLLLFLALGISCGVHDWSFDEVARASNPSGQVDAVLVERNGGATTSFGYRIYVVPTGQPVSRSDAAIANLYGAVRNKNAYGIDFKWDGTNRLAGEYLHARHAEIEAATTAVAGREIIITLRSNINNTAAPPGGMLYNLQKNH